MKSLRKCSPLFAFVIVMTGCSGGGGGGPTPPSIPSTPSTQSPITGPTTTPPTVTAPPAATPPPSTPAPVAPTPSPAPSASPLAITGKMLNKDTGAPLSGAVVYVSHTLQPTDTAPMAAPSDGNEVTTLPDGTYVMTLPAQGKYPSTFYVEVYSPGKVTVHSELTVNGQSMNQIRDLKLTTLSADEANWFTLLNQDRAKYGRQPLFTDETTQEIARIWVAFLATGYYQHVCNPGDVNCPDKSGYAASQFAPFSAAAENIAGSVPPSTYVYAENAFMAEATNCPQPANPDTCPFTETTGHFINIEQSGAIWGAVSEAFNGIDFRNSANKLDYYDQEFSYPNRSGNTVY